MTNRKTSVLALAFVLPCLCSLTDPAYGGNGDFDGNGILDLADFAAFQRCFTGSTGDPISEACAPGDSGLDDDIDLDDWADFLPRFTGPGSFGIVFRTPPPVTLSSGDEFDIEFELIGDFVRVDGSLGACLSPSSVESCRFLEHRAFEPIPGTSFAPPGSFISGDFFEGSPGLYGQRIRAFDCEGPNDYFFVVSATFEDQQGDQLGPFFSQALETTVAAPTAPILKLDRENLEFNALIGIDPPPRPFVIGTECGTDDVDWSAVADVPWITLEPSSGAFNGNTLVTVSIDVTGLEAGEHIGIVTVESPQATNDPLTLVVTLNVL